MGISLQSGFPKISSSSPLSFSTVAQNDIVLASFQSNNGADTLGTPSSTTITGWTFICRIQSSSQSRTIELWWGKVTGTPGSDSISATWTNGSMMEISAAEFHTTIGSPTWKIIGSSAAKNDSSTTTISWGSITSGSAADQGAYGYARCPGTYSASSFSLIGGNGANDQSDGNGNGEVWATSLATSTGYNPTSSQSSGAFCSTWAIFTDQSATTYNQTTTATATSTSKLTRSIGQTYRATATSTATNTNSIGRKITASVTSTASTVAMKVRLVTTLAVVTTSATLKRSIGKIVQATPSSTVSMVRQIALHVQAAPTTVINAFKGLALKVVAAVTSSSTVTPQANYIPRLGILTISDFALGAVNFSDNATAIASFKDFSTGVVTITDVGG